MLKREIKLILAFVFSVGYTLGQADCVDADYGCTLGSFTTNSSGDGNISELPGGNNISNPSTNPGSAGNSGCLLSGENNPTWIILTVSSPGYLEFTLGTAGGSGFYDWSLWPYYEAGSPQSINGGDACSEIENNLLPPVACNWNGASAGFTGMVEQGNLPPGANPANFENSFLVQPGDQFVLCFSNFSGLVGQNVPIYTGSDIPGSNGSNPADVTCDPSSVATTICLGDTATVTINTGGITGATFTFLNNAGDLVDPTAPGPTFDLDPIDSTIYDVEVTNGTITDTVQVTVDVVPPPNPDAGADFTVCSGAVGTLNGTQSQHDTVSTIQWSYIGPGGNPGVPNVNFSPDDQTADADINTNNDGTYTFTLTESNGVCPDVSDDVDVTFEDPAISVQGTDPDCFGGSNGEIHIDAPLAINYSFDNGTTWQMDSFATGFAAGNYTVCIETANNCEKCEDVTINEGVQVQVDVANDTTICENGTATLTAQGIGGSNFNYNWAHTTSNADNVQVNPDSQTTYTVEAVNQDGCVSDEEQIEVDVLPPLDGMVSDDQTICPGYDTQVIAEASGGNGGPYSYEWTDPGGNVVATTDTLTAAPSSTTVYTVSITDNCESTPFEISSEVVVAPVPEVDFEVDKNNKCVPATFELINTTDPSLSEDTYWLISDGQSFVNLDSLSLTLDQAGQYSVKLVVTTPDGCIDSLNKSQFLTVHPKPRAKFNFIPNPVTMLNTEVSFQNYSTGAVDYQWFFEDGTPATSTLEEPEMKLPEGEEAKYEIELVANSIHDCKDTAKTIIQVESEVIIYAPNTFTPDGDAFNPTWRVFIEGIDVQDFDLEIYNRWGELVWESHNPEAEWDATYGGQGGEKVPQGTYVWKVRTRDSINDDKFEWQGHVTVLY
mgnify:CR=1 FL=1